METGCAVIAGVGPGLGAALAQRFADGGLSVAAAARDVDRLGGVVDELTRRGDDVRAYACDVGHEGDVQDIFEQAEADLGPLRVAVFNAGAFEPASVVDIEADDFERCWRVGCLGGFLVGREAARRMLELGRGTILFTGATAAWRGGAGFANLAVPKFGLRALAQSMARELGPKGIHVAHVVIDGQIAPRNGQPGDADEPPDARLSPTAIAETYWQLHRQHPSAWTFETDLRPWVERF